MDKQVDGWVDVYIRRFEGSDPQETGQVGARKSCAGRLR